jgi:MFS family permease
MRGVSYGEGGIGSPLVCAAATGVANLLGTIVAMQLIDTKGRRSLLIYGAFGMAAAMAMAALLVAGVCINDSSWKSMFESGR